MGHPLDGAACHTDEEGQFCSIETGIYPCHYANCRCTAGTWRCVADTWCYDMAKPRDSAQPADLGLAVRPGRACNGMTCGANEFCMLELPGVPRPNDLGPPEPRCIAVPACLANPTCDCFIGEGNEPRGNPCYHSGCEIAGDMVRCIGQ